MEAATEAKFVHDMDNFKATELRLGLPGSEEPEKPTIAPTRGNKRSLEATDEPCQAMTDSTKANKYASYTYNFAFFLKNNCFDCQILRLNSP
jgi:hypothetical protein